MHIKTKHLFALSYLYLYIPVFLFLSYWVKFYFSVPIIVLLSVGLYEFVKEHDAQYESASFHIDRKVIICLAIIALWVALSGIGGLMWQNRWDHMFRNAIFNDLVNYNWPVVNSDYDNPRMLCYYFGFWLPSAAIGKIFGSLTAGYAAQYIWAFLGVSLTLLLIFERVGKSKVRTALIFVFFSGLDIVSYLLSNLLRGIGWSAIFQSLKQFPHIELALDPFNAPSNTTQLFWIYNQTIPFWVGFILLLFQKNNKSVVLISSLFFLCSPFPLIATLPAIVYICFRNSPIEFKNLGKSVKEFFSQTLTIGNIGGLLCMLTTALFFMANISGTKITPVIFTEPLMFRVILYSLTEFLVFVLFFWKKVKHDKLFWFIIITKLVCTLLLNNGKSEFIYKTSPPLVFYTMLLLIGHMNGITIDKLKHSLKAKLLTAVICIGAFTPGIEMLRTVKNTSAVIQKESKDPFLSGGLDSVFHPNSCYENFIGSDTSLFYKYFER